MQSSILSTYKRSNLSFVKGKGSYLITKNGKKYLDFASGIAVNSLGHCNSELIKVLNNQSKKMWHISNAFQIPEQEELAKKLTKLTFADKVFFCNSGAESVESAIKIARAYYQIKKKKKKKFKIITIKGSFHGRTLATISASGKKKLTDGFQPLLEGFIQVEFGDHQSIEKVVDDQTAAIMVEPILGEGGIKVIPNQCLEGLRKLCNKKNILLIFDEVQCGVGRTGKLFSYQWSKIKPDILTTAKGIGGGFPIGACLVTNKVSKGMKLGSHGSTFGGNPLACSVANKVIEIVSKKKFLDDLNQKATFFLNKLEKVKNTYNHLIEEIRGKGFLLGIKSKINNSIFIDKLRNNGLLIVGASENIIRILPPLNVTKKELKIALKIIEKTCMDINSKK
jgi:acetylornithine/N-succinyldiaminopimelate aminotransferase